MVRKPPRYKMRNPAVPKATARPVRFFRRLDPRWLDHGPSGEPLDLLRVSIRRRAVILEPGLLLRHRRNRSSGRTFPPADPRPRPQTLGADPATGKPPSRRSDSLRRI